MSKTTYVAITRDEGTSYVVLIGEPGESEQDVFSRAAEKILPRHREQQRDIWSDTQLKNLQTLTKTATRRHFRDALENYLANDTQDCPACGGRGYESFGPLNINCPACGGTGIVSADRDDDNDDDNDE